MFFSTQAQHYIFSSITLENKKSLTVTALFKLMSDVFFLKKSGQIFWFIQMLPFEQTKENC